jgi:hypothetical protein
MGSNFFFLGIVIAVIGVGIFFPARSARKRDQMRLSWPTAKATVMSAEVVQPQALAAGTSKNADQFDVSVKYQFRAGGQLHFGASVSYPRYLYREQEADRIVSRYPAGATVTVYYNPEDPRECYLEIQNTAKYYRTSIVIMVAGGLAFLFGILQTFG